MAGIDKLNKTFVAEQVLTAKEMNQLTAKIDELVEGTNKATSDIGSIANILDEINGEIV